jgi:hypothetical protein
MKKINEMFLIDYPKLHKSKMTSLPYADGGVNFIAQSAKHHGIRGTVAILPEMKPYPGGLITVSLGGTPLVSFVQERPFYASKNVAVLSPIEKMTFVEKFYVCLCISHNKYRYSAFGRAANRTLRELLIPSRDHFPEWLNDPSIKVSVQTAIERDVCKLFLTFDE